MSRAIICSLLPSILFQMKIIASICVTAISTKVCQITAAATTNTMSQRMHASCSANLNQQKIACMISTHLKAFKTNRGGFLLPEKHLKVIIRQFYGTQAYLVKFGYPPLIDPVLQILWDPSNGKILRPPTCHIGPCTAMPLLIVDEQ